MKILQIHNYYQHAGGEDVVFSAENKLLKSKNNEVEVLKVNNSSIVSFLDKVCVMLQTPFSLSTYRKISAHLKHNKPDIVHIHNYFPIYSPSIFYACKKKNIPVVHTLHNYRAICPTAILMYQGKIEEKSVTASCWWTIKRKVYKDSLIGSVALAAMVELHKKINTWNTKVDRYIALTQFAKSKYIQAGWPKNKISVKPNFCRDYFKGIKHIKKTGGYGLFVGRLSHEKGVKTLLTAWKEIDYSLKIIGDGPEQRLVQEHACSQIEYLGTKEKKEVLHYMQHADFIIMPSLWYEGFPMVLIEALECGTPAIVSDLGSLSEVIGDGVTGLHFEAGNAVALAEKIQWMLKNKEKRSNMSDNARREYLVHYTSEENYKMLMTIYQQAIDESKGN